MKFFVHFDSEFIAYTLPTHLLGEYVIAYTQLLGEYICAINEDMFSHLHLRIDLIRNTKGILSKVELFMNSLSSHSLMSIFVNIRKHCVKT